MVLGARCRCRGLFKGWLPPPAAPGNCNASRSVGGRVHRDLKPGNLFLARADGQEVLKILDFGIAAAGALAPLEASAEGFLVGTPHYMSAEQINTPASVDHRSDLYSLGIVVYEALTGRQPIHADSIVDLLTRITGRGEPIPPPSSLHPDLGPAVDEFFERALAREPSARFQSARELASAFAALADISSTQRPIKVLVVDDEDDIPILIRHRFRSQIHRGRYTFVFANEGGQALEQLRNHPDIDLVLSDINMPGMDGLTLLQRAPEINPIVKIVIVSAYGDMDNIREAMNRGAFDFLTKPIDFADLEKTIEKTSRQVASQRRSLRSEAENLVLRQLTKVSPLASRVPVSGALPQEQVEGTAVVVEVRGTDSAAATVAEARRLSVSRAYEEVISVFLARGGTVESVLGPLLLAVFRGTDHQDRALSACLALTSRPSPAGSDGNRLPLGIGLESGALFYGPLWTQLATPPELSVSGLPVTAALRLASRAADDQILLSTPPAGALRERYDGESLTLPTPPGPLPERTFYRVIGRRDDGPPEDEGSPQLASPAPAGQKPSGRAPGWSGALAATVEIKISDRE